MPNKKNIKIITWIILICVMTFACAVLNASPLDLIIIIFGAFILGDLWILFFQVCRGILIKGNKSLLGSNDINLLPRVFIFSLTIILIACKVLWVSYNHPASILESGDKLKSDLIERQKYLVSKIISNDFGPEDSPVLLSQEFKEEWAIGTLSMLGSALTNIAFMFPEYRLENLQHLKMLIERMLKRDIRIYEIRYWNEDALDSLDSPNGHIGYLGHLNYLLGAYRVLGGGLEFDELHQKISSSLGRRIKNSPHYFLETFPGQIFIPDNAVVLASLKLYNLSHKTEIFKSEIDLWLNYVKNNLIDRKTGIILPWINQSGVAVGTPRGSYSTWNIFYLLQVDQMFSKKQSKLVKKHFLKKLPFNLCGIREYPHGQFGPPDVDSGPIIFGVSTSGSGFGLATANFLNDNEFQKCLLLTAEVVGSTISSGEGTRYLIAPLIGDAIVLAMRTATFWDGRFLK